MKNISFVVRGILTCLCNENLIDFCSEGHLVQPVTEFSPVCKSARQSRVSGEIVFFFFTLLQSHKNVDQ